jgi:hypothetical protein
MSPTREDIIPVTCGLMGFPECVRKVSAAVNKAGLDGSVIEDVVYGIDRQAMEKQRSFTEIAIRIRITYQRRMERPSLIAVPAAADYARIRRWCGAWKLSGPQPHGMRKTQVFAHQDMRKTDVVAHPRTVLRS